jgi:hypothetical protein
MGIYEYGVRRFNVMRFLFGMKLLIRPVAAQPKETPLKGAIRTM